MQRHKRVFCDAVSRRISNKRNWGNNIKWIINFDYYNSLIRALGDNKKDEYLIVWKLEQDQNYATKPFAQDVFMPKSHLSAQYLLLKIVKSMKSGD